MNIAEAYEESQRLLGKGELTEDGLELVPPEPWKAEMGLVEEPSGEPKILPVSAVRVALCRAAGITDTVELGSVLGMAPAKVCALEALDGFANALKRIKMVAGLGSWRSHVEGVVATGVLPSGTVAPAPTQAQMLLELWGREEPKVRDEEGQAHKTVVVITGDGMARVMAGLAEGRGSGPVDVTPRRMAPSTDAELEKQREVYHRDE